MTTPRDPSYATGTTIYEMARGALAPTGRMPRLLAPDAPTGEVGVRGTLYILHFSRPLGHARHYLGWTTDFASRLETHRCGRGARITQVAVQRGIDLIPALLIDGVTRDQERHLKDRHRGFASRHCPVCEMERQLQERKN